jgi:hypothetical protein
LSPEFRPEPSREQDMFAPLNTASGFASDQNCYRYLST